MNDKYVRCHICEAVNLDRGGEVECRKVWGETDSILGLEVPN